ncbi:MAG: vWA domain-containing protein [Bacteroidota bacterium]|nr:vWA domain-containing protein [Bacteroidota bacterium]
MASPGNSSSTSIPLRFLVCVLTLACAAYDVSAQPSVTIRRTIVNYPIIDLYFTASCGGTPFFRLDESHVRLTEDDLDIRAAEFTCPDTTVRCPMSVSLVLDASGSMVGEYNGGTKEGTRAFIRRMDGLADRAAIVWFNNAATIAHSITADTGALLRVIDSLPAAGGTALWDALYIGLLQLAAADPRSCRAVVLVTDGTDNASTTPVATVVSFAARQRIRIFPVGIGAAYAPEQLRQAAEATGGVYYHSQDGASLAPILTEIASIILQGFRECRLTYRSACADGGIRELGLTVLLPCGPAGAVTSFRAPSDPLTFQPILLRVGNTASPSDTETAMTLWMDGPEMREDEVLYPAAFSIVLDTSLARVTAFAAPSGYAFEGARFTVRPTATGADVVSSERAIVRPGGTPRPAALIHITTGGHAGPDSVHIPVSIPNWTFSGGCRFPYVGSGILSIAPRAPRIHAEASVPSRLRWNCWRDAYEPEPATVTVTVRNLGGGYAEAGRIRIESETGAIELTGPTSAEQNLEPARIPPFGTASARWNFRAMRRAVTDSLRLLFTATFSNHPPVEFSCALLVPASLTPLPIELDGPPYACEGTGRVLSAPPGYTGYIWSTNENTRSILVTHTGTYSYTAVTEDGDLYCSDSVRIVARPNPLPIIVASGSLVFCHGDSLRLETERTYASYRWSTGETTPSIIVREAGRYAVTVVDTFGCEGSSGPVFTRHHVPPAPVISGPVSLCRFDTGRYTVANDSGWALFWSAWNGTILGDVSSDTVAVRWANTSEGIVSVSAVSPVTGCTGRAVFPVRLEPQHAPRITPIGATLCRGDSIMLAADTGFATYRWSDGATTRIRAVKNRGVYAVEAADRMGCRAVSDSVTIHVNDPPMPRILGPADVCRGDTVIYITAPTAGNEYEWNIVGGHILLRPSPWYIYAVWSDQEEGRVVLRERAGRCDGHDTLRVTIRSGPKPDVIAHGPLRFCEGDSVFLEAGDGFASYRWSNGETTRTVVIREGGTYILRVTSGAVCPGWSDSIEVRVLPPPPKPSITRNGDSLSATGSALSYAWFRDGSRIAGETGRSMRLPGVGRYEVEATDGNGCTARSDPYDVSLLSAGHWTDADRRLEVFPHPTGGTFTVRIIRDRPSEVVLRIRDPFGRIVLRETILPGEEIFSRNYSLPFLPDGVYAVEMETPGSMLRSRIVIVH